ncbi:hypothetical protein ZYGR_0AD04400 [Zygosaccharomyces rouxii]|uniref:ZYRO0G16302p n=2 Tax=Zygosaccharomyces rouxii TaxID=4956 RepID=C5E0X2_ZYGRC|nr:uncharacterized protein ZYRO0G16302g [Zygosaccharomyces rouxii]KAH9202749.1 major facilitator superfamily domain-containing protein [Zygosaccharomyces rouxii]GAV51257.1 hypothetical protein ZYGR_0AD04400 [Zygosaccharomyces rouxii]CAR29756.1 ZYRO0G16302p [Zygosaccharomyces rouxii]
MLAASNEYNSNSSRTENAEMDIEEHPYGFQNEPSSALAGSAGGELEEGMDATRANSLNPDEDFLKRIETSVSQTNEGKNLQYEVSFEEGSMDPENIAMHLSWPRKYYVSTLVTLISGIITMISSCWSLVAEDVMSHFHISREVSVLGISLYIFGLGCGPLLLSPISELYGRRITFIFSLSFSVAWQCLVIWSPTIEGVLFGRFLSGFFGSSFLSVASGTISDIFTKDQIGIPMTFYALAPFAGPSLGPVLSGAFNKDGYKWPFIVMMIVSSVLLGLVTFTVPESYKPVLLIRKAKRLRKETGDDKYFAPLEVIRREANIFRLILLSVKRPIDLLLRDYMIGVLSFYTGLVLAIIYLYFTVFPYIYPKLWNFTVMETGLAYLGLLIGMIIVCPSCLIFQKNYARRVERNGGKSTPEMRFEALFYGAFCTPIGLMIFAWTCYSHVHWIGSLIGSAVFGAGVFFVFVGVFAYTVDAYRRYAASAMACNTFVRCIMAGVFPLFGRQMYKGMGINWAGFLLAMVAVGMIPVPFLFSKYGSVLRAKSPYGWDD